MARFNKKDIEYNNSSISELKMAMKTEKSLRTYKRYAVVLKHFKGFTNRAIADIDGIDVLYIKNYR